MHPTCGVSQCQLPTQDLICQPHVRALTGALKALAVEHGGGPSLLDELDVVITRRAKIAGLPIGIVVHSAETRLPFHDPASELRIATYRELATWGIVMADANPHLQRRQRTPRETAAWLSTIPGLLANLPGVEDMHPAIVRRQREIERMIDRPPTMVMLGICSTRADDGGQCQRHLYAPLDDENRPPSWIRCFDCGTDHEVLERQIRLIAAADATTGTAGEVSRVLGRIGIVIPASTIRGWAQRRISRGSVIQPRIRAVDATVEGHPLYSIQEVLSVYLSGREKRWTAA